MGRPDANQAGKVNLPVESFQRETAKNERWEVNYFITSVILCRSRGLPGYCYFIAWILTFILIFGGVALVAAYGISFGNLKTYQWVTAMVVNFFWNIFIESLVKVSP